MAEIGLNCVLVIWGFMKYENDLVMARICFVGLIVELNMVTFED